MKLGELFESYEERVQKVADHVKWHIERQYGDVGLKPDVHGLIRTYGAHTLEGRLGGKAYKDFHADVHKAVRPAMAKVGRSIGGRATAAQKAETKKNLDRFHERVGTEIETQIGNHVPDGDPFDALIRSVPRIARQHNIDVEDHEVIDHLHAASKKLGFQDYHDHLAHSWDGYNDSEPEVDHEAEARFRLNPADPNDWLKRKQSEKGAIKLVPNPPQKPKPENPWR